MLVAIYVAFSHWLCCLDLFQLISSADWALLISLKLLLPLQSAVSCHCHLVIYPNRLRESDSLLCPVHGYFAHWCCGLAALPRFLSSLITSLPTFTYWKMNSGVGGTSPLILAHYCRSICRRISAYTARLESYYLPPISILPPSSWTWRQAQWPRVGTYHYYSFASLLWGHGNHRNHWAFLWEVLPWWN